MQLYQSKSAAMHSRRPILFDG